MINKLPQLSFIYDRRKVASSSKASSIELRITYQQKQKYISTGIKVYPKQWKNGKIINCPDAIQQNALLDKMLSDTRQVILNLVQENTLDLSLIPRILKTTKENINFIDYCIQRTAIRKYGKTSDSQARYDRFLKLFISWGKVSTFQDITEANIILFDRFLSERNLMPYSKWNNYHRFFNSFILDAINDGYLRRNPYQWVNIEKNKNNSGIDKYLSPEEFIKLKSTTMPTESLRRIQDVFIFQTYTCLSYSDLKEFNPDNIQDVKGMKVYIGSRKKTNRSFVIPLLFPALNILHKYKYTLPVVSNVKYNEYLKVVAQMAGIDKPLSSHWARHTGATLLLNEGIDMKIVSKICGHSSTRITEQVYAKLLNETIVDAVQNFKI